MSSTGNLIVVILQEKKTERQFQQQQLEQFDALLANYNWSSVFNFSGIDRLKVNTFLQITENMISEYFPEKTVRIYSKDKPFMTSKIKRLILKRNIKKNKKVELVRSLRKRITAEIPRAKMSFYYNKVGSNLKNCPKSWCKHIIEVFDG